MKKQILDIYNTYNSLDKYQNYLIKKYFCDDPIIKKDELTEDEMFYCIEAFTQSTLLLIKEKIIENEGNLNYKSKIFDEKLDFYTNLYSCNSNNFDGTSAELFTIIRNKLAHGDFELDCKNNKIILKRPEEDIVLNLESLMYLIKQIITNLPALIKEKEYTRNIVLNKGKALSRNSNSKEIENFIKTLTKLQFKFSRRDNYDLTYEDKMNLENYIKYLVEEIRKKKNINIIKKNIQDHAKIFGYNLNIKISKIEDKKTIKTMKKTVKNSPVAYKNFDDTYISYLYGNLLTKKIGEKYNFDALIVGNDYAINNIHMIYNQKTSKEDIIKLKAQELTNLNLPFNIPAHELYEKNLLISNNIKNAKDYYKLKEIINWNKSFEEIFMSLIVAKFISLYSNPLDEIYKINNEYNYEREEILNFGLLDLSSLKPEIINIDYHPLEEIKRKLNRAQKKVISSYKNNLLAIKDYTSYIEKNKKEEVKEKLTERINDSYKRIETSNEKLKLIAKLHNKIDEDYKINHKHFENLALIEGIRNSIAHGNVRILDLYENDNVLDTKIEFTNIYQGKVYFKLTASWNEIDEIFKKENQEVILNYFNHKIETNNEEKVLKK